MSTSDYILFTILGLSVCATIFFLFKAEQNFRGVKENVKAVAAGSEFDEGGLPKHLAMGVTADGQGPENDDTAHHFVCWCKDSDCDWNIALASNTRKAKAAALREAKVASVRASVLQGHLDALRKVLFEDAATDHDMRLRKAHAVIRQVEKMEPFDNAYASLRAERDALAARLAAVEALADEWEQGRWDNPAPTYADAGRYGAAMRLRDALATNPQENDQGERVD